MHQPSGHVMKWLAATGAVLLLVSPFLGWSGGSKSDVLVLFGGLNRKGAFSLIASRNAWESYPFAAACLVAVSAAIIIAVVVDRRPALDLALVVACAALIFAVSQLVDPSGPDLPISWAHLPGRFVSHTFPASGGAGEPVATLALVLALIGLIGGMSAGRTTT